MRIFFLLCFTLVLLSSCASKKEILYLQDVDDYNGSAINFERPTIQSNDILSIKVSSLIPETAEPYNMQSSGSNQNTSPELIRLQGYMVTELETINFPVLGPISTRNKTVLDLQNEITELLESGGHLKNPFVDVKVLNAKFTVLGEVGSPGTFNLAEQNITLLQALGFAGDLTINGKREDILVLREVDGIQQVSRVDLTSAEFMTSPSYFIRANDVIVVNPNNPEVKRAGFITNPFQLISVFTLILTTVVLFTR